MLEHICCVLDCIPFKLAKGQNPSASGDWTPLSGSTSLQMYMSRHQNPLELYPAEHQEEIKMIRL